MQWLVEEALEVRLDLVEAEQAEQAELEAELHAAAEQARAEVRRQLAEGD